MIGVMKNNFTAFHIPIESPTPTIEHATKDPFRFLNYTGLLFNRQSLPVTYFWQVARSLILTVSCFSLFSVVLYHTIVYSKLSIKHASYYLVCNWHLQACFNVILIHYWQCTGQWSSQLISVYQSNKTKRVFKRIGWLMVTLNFMIIGFLISVHFARHFDNKYSVIFSFDQIFENPLFSNLARLISFYTIVIFFVCNFYFITSNAIVFEELHDFNRKFTNGLSCRSVNMIDGNSEIASVLYSFYLKHLMISNKVRALDRSWSVFAFTSAITTIPTVVFGLWTFIIRLQSSGIHILITSIELLLCCFALLFLVVYPARIREEIHETRALLFSSLSVWENYSPKICDIGKIFVAHLDQGDLAVSIWQFVTISKQFVLSIVSITVTLLIFLVETQNGTKTLAVHQAMTNLVKTN
ncbi:hypothetical protein M3Y95_00983700 [Aphelenchoides besseyi]|nr:hypothetical protein M3Y95_00983700 [Aphelenchoides besseyi]